MVKSPKWKGYPKKLGGLIYSDISLTKFCHFFFDPAFVAAHLASKALRLVIHQPQSSISRHSFRQRPTPHGKLQPLISLKNALGDMATTRRSTLDELCSCSVVEGGLGLSVFTLARFQEREGSGDIGM